MLRITTHRAPEHFAMKLEGWLVGSWVEELDTTWRAATRQLDTSRICVDLGDVYFVDEAGRELLTEMYRSGVRFVTKGCVMPEVVREISETSLAGRS